MKIENIELLKAITVFGLSGFFMLLYIISGISLKNIEKKSKIILNTHNRKVMLGIDVTDPDYSINDDCFHTKSFLKMENSGTFDTSNIKEIHFHLYATNEDFFLKEKE